MQDKIKAILDEDCWERKVYWREFKECTCQDYMEADIEEFPNKRCNPKFKPECWMCHKNDELSQRIAEEVCLSRVNK